MAELNELGDKLTQCRDQIYLAVRDHEQKQHDGAKCANERLNAMAFICHSLGLDHTDVAMKIFQEVLAEYAVRCGCRGRHLMN